MTPHYASPEQLHGERVTTASDVYALGILLYKLLTGRLPHRLEGRPVAEIEKIVDSEEPTRPSTAVTMTDEDDATEGGDETSSMASRYGTELPKLQTQLTGDLDNIVLMALRKEPERRYASPDALADDLRRHLDGLPVEARQDNLGYRVGKFVNRHRAAVAASALALIVVVGFAVAMAVQATRLERQRAEAESARLAETEVSRFLADLFNEPRPGRSFGQDTTALEVLRRGAERLETDHQDQPELQAKLGLMLSPIFHDMADNDRAEATARQAILAQGIMSEPDYPGRTEAVCHLIAALTAQNRLEEARMEGYEALNSFARHESVPPQLYLKLMNLIGRAEAFSENSQSARILFSEALELAEAQLKPDDEAIASLSYDSGGLAYQEGRFDDASPLLRRAMAIWQTSDGSSNRLASALAALGGVLAEQGRLAEAEELIRRSIGLKEKIYGEGHPLLANGYLAAANMLLLKSKHKEASEFARKAAAIASQPPSSERVKISALILQCETEMHLGRFQQAESYCQNGYDRIQDSSAHQENLSTILRLQAQLASTAGNWSLARQRFDKSLEFVVLRFGATGVRTALHRAAYGRHALRHGELDTAQIHLEEARSVLLSTDQSDSLDLAIASADLARVHSSKFETNKAEDLFKVAWVIAQSSTETETHRIGEIQDSYVRFLADQGRTNEAANIRDWVPTRAPNKR